MYPWGHKWSKWVNSAAPEDEAPASGIPRSILSITSDFICAHEGSFSGKSTAFQPECPPHLSFFYLKPFPLCPWSLIKLPEGQTQKCVLVTQRCLTVCNPKDYSPSGSSVHGILQARVLEEVAFVFSRSSSWPRDGTQVSCIADELITVWATREIQKSYHPWAGSATNEGRCPSFYPSEQQFWGTTYWVGQKIHSDSSVRCYGKTWVTSLANSIHSSARAWTPVVGNSKQLSDAVSLGFPPSLLPFPTLSPSK